MKFHLDRFILSSCGGKKTPIFAVFAGFWTSVFCGVASWQQSEKVEHGCTTTNLPLSNGGEILHGGGDLLRAKFHPHRCNVSTLRNEKRQNRPLSKLNTGRLALRSMLPVKIKKTDVAQKIFFNYIHVDVIATKYLAVNMSFCIPAC